VRSRRTSLFRFTFDSRSPRAPRTDASSARPRASALAALAVVVATLPCLRLAHAQPGPASASPAGPASASAPSERTIWRESFDTPSLDFVDPARHDARELARVYTIGHDGDDPLLHALHSDPKGTVPAMHYGKAFDKSPPPLEHVRALRWRWRVLRHPDVGRDAWADLAASVYVITRVPTLLHGGRGFKLGWLAKPGPEHTYQRGLLQIPLREGGGGASGGGAAADWRAESIDLCALYRRTFGACEGEHVLYVGVMTDADDTRSAAEAEYDDFELVGDP
jgi:hypothetical protein